MFKNLKTVICFPDTFIVHMHGHAEGLTSSHISIHF